MKIIKPLILISILLSSMFFLSKNESLESTFYLFQIIIGILLFFTCLIGVLKMKKNSLSSELWSRTLTFWWMSAIFLLTVNIDYRLTFLPLALLACFSCFELNNLFPTDSKNIKRFQYVLLGIIPILCLYVSYFSFLSIASVGITVVLPILLISHDKIDDHGRNFILLSNYFLFCVIGFSHFYFLLKVGTSLFVAILFLTQLRDLISYWLGKLSMKLIQNHSHKKIIYRIVMLRVAGNVSPNKTWFVGILSTVLLAGFSFKLQSVYEESGGLNHFSEYHSLALGILIGISGLYGDLYFSYLKRISGVKDSGSTLPGGEGALDRVDGLLLTVPLVYIYLVTFNLI